MRGNFAAALALLALSACAARTWVKPGASTDDFRKDRYECQRDMRMGHFSGDFVGAIEQGQFFNDCMEVRGWRLTSISPEAIQQSTGPEAADLASRWATTTRDCRAVARGAGGDQTTFSNANDRCMKERGF